MSECPLQPGTEVILFNAGTFNPLHGGHIEALDEAAEICKKCGLIVKDKILSPNGPTYMKNKMSHDPNQIWGENLRKEIEQEWLSNRPDIKIDYTNEERQKKGQPYLRRSQLSEIFRNKYNAIPIIVGGDDTVGGGWSQSGSTITLSTSRKENQSSSALRSVVPNPSNIKNLQEYKGVLNLPAFALPQVSTNNISSPVNNIQTAKPKAIKPKLKTIKPKKNIKLNATKIKDKIAIKITREDWIKISQQKGLISNAFGGVVINDKGEVLLVEPLNHFDNTVWTFPKGKQDKGEAPEQTALREVREETGVSCKIISLLPGQYPGTTSVTQYYLMSPLNQTEDFDKETASVKWVNPQEAIKLINMTGKASAKQRDLAVLSEAVSHMPKVKPAQNPQNPQQKNTQQQPNSSQNQLPQI